MEKSASAPEISAQYSAVFRVIKLARAQIYTLDAELRTSKELLTLANRASSDIAGSQRTALVERIKNIQSNKRAFEEIIQEILISFRSIAIFGPCECPAARLES